MHMSEDDHPAISVAAGLTVGLVASLVQSLGLTIQRKSHILSQAESSEGRKSDLRRPLWLLGFVIFITSNVLGSVFQIASLPVVILAPLGAVSLLWNAFFARLILGDVFSKFLIFGTVLVIGGAVLVGIFGIVPEPTHSLDDLLALFGRTGFVVYFTLLGVLVFGILAVTHIIEWRWARRNSLVLLDVPSAQDPEPAIVASPPSSLLSSPVPLSSERTPLINPSDKLHVPHHGMPAEEGAGVPTFLAISYASMSGILSGMCLIFAKSGVELLVLTATGNNQFTRWESWVLVFGLVVFAILQLWYLQKSLIFDDPTLVCPLAFCFYNLSSILNGLIYYDQFERLSSLQLGLVILGTLLLLGGVWAVSIQEDDEDVIVVPETAEIFSDEPGILGDPVPVRESTLAASQVPPLTVEVIDSGNDDVFLSPSASIVDRGPLPTLNLNRRVVSSPSALSDVTPLPLVSSEDIVSSPNGRGRRNAPPGELVLQRESSYPVHHGTSRVRTRTLSGSVTMSRVLSAPQSDAHAVTSPLSPIRRRLFNLGSRRRGTITTTTTDLNSSVLSSSSTGSQHQRHVSTSSTAPLVAPPGFSIGLSPVSPGFGLVPRARDRDLQDDVAARPSGVLRPWAKLKRAAFSFSRTKSNSSQENARIERSVDGAPDE